MHVEVGDFVRVVIPEPYSSSAMQTSRRIDGRIAEVVAKHLYVDSYDSIPKYEVTIRIVGVDYALHRYTVCEDFLVPIYAHRNTRTDILVIDDSDIATDIEVKEFYEFV